MSWRSLNIRLLFGISDWNRDRKLKIPETVLVRKDLSYGPGGKWNRLDLVTPRDAKGLLPVIVSIHGGAFVYGTKEVYQYYAASLAENGFAVINFNYRLAPEHRFPAQLEDTERVMAWLLNHASEYGLDPDRVFLVGDSAGAQLACHYAALNSNPEFGKRFSFHRPGRVKFRAVALNCGLYEILPRQGIAMDPVVRDYLEPGQKMEDPRLDVMGAITEAFPPAYVMTAEEDFLREAAKPMYERLVNAGVPAKYALWTGSGQTRLGHVFHVNMNLPEAKQCNREQCEFFRTYL